MEFANLSLVNETLEESITTQVKSELPVKALAAIALNSILMIPIKEFNIVTRHERIAIVHFTPWGEDEASQTKEEPKIIEADPKPKEVTTMVRYIDYDPISPIPLMDLTPKVHDAYRLYLVHLIQWQSSWTFSKQSLWGRRAATVASQLTHFILTTMEHALSKSEKRYLFDWIKLSITNPNMGNE